MDFISALAPLSVEDLSDGGSLSQSHHNGAACLFLFYRHEENSCGINLGRNTPCDGVRRRRREEMMDVIRVQLVGPTLLQHLRYVCLEPRPHSDLSFVR